MAVKIGSAVDPSVNRRMTERDATYLTTRDDITTEHIGRKLQNPYISLRKAPLLHGRLDGLLGWWHFLLRLAWLDISLALVENVIGQIVASEKSASDRTELTISLV